MAVNCRKKFDECVSFEADFNNVKSFIEKILKKP